MNAHRSHAHWPCLGGELRARRLRSWKGSAARRMAGALRGRRAALPARWQHAAAAAITCRPPGCPPLLCPADFVRLAMTALAALVYGAIYWGEGRLSGETTSTAVVQNISGLIFSMSVL